MKNRQILFLTALALGLGAAAATVRCGTVTLPTYPYGDPDPVPATSDRAWPYHKFDGTSVTSVPRTWKTVELENDRIRVTMLPEIGGKVWGAVDKRTGREFIYYNHAVKFRNIALRGPWCSGGIEMNFGLMSHTASTVSAVDWTTRENADGSVSYFCGNEELILGTTWQVEVRLRDGDDFFTTSARWHNGSGLPQMYYQWMTAAYTGRHDPRFAFPGTHYVGHEGDAHAWPSEAGHDISHYAENAFGHNKSYHIVGGDERAFIVWWPELSFGSFHDCAWGEKYGRKIWLWGLSREGAIWEDLLTDADGQYVELQSGRVFSQARKETFRTPFKFPTFQPGVTDLFTERWGVVRDAAAVTALAARTNLTTRPVVTPSGFDWDRSAYGLYARAHQAARECLWALAEEKVEAALAKDPLLTPALVLKAELAYRAGRPVHALAERALALDAYEPEANYLDGFASLEELHNPDQALERFGLAAYSPLFRAAAYGEMARIEAARGNFVQAGDYVKKAQAANAESPETAWLAIQIARRSGRRAEAVRLLRAARAAWPLHAALRREALLTGELSAQGFRDECRGETDDETLLTLALDYARCGDREAARGLLAENPLFLAKVHAAVLEGGTPAAFARAAAGKVTFAKPFRRADARALEQAMAAHPSWKFRYLRALYAAANRETARAEELAAACDLADEASVFLWRARLRTGTAQWVDLMRARTLSDDARAARDLAAHHAAAGEHRKAADLLTTAVKRFPKANYLHVPCAAALLAAGDAQACVTFLLQHEILPSEYEDNALASWQEAWRALGDELLAQTIPENLGAGACFEAAFVACEGNRVRFPARFGAETPVASVADEAAAEAAARAGRIAVVPGTPAALARVKKSLERLKIRQ